MAEKPTYPSWEQPELRFRVPQKIHEELHNIADNSGYTLNDFVRHKLTELTNNYPATMKLPVKKD
jgi:predicted HicB family RNase H-like nuclease